MKGLRIVLRILIVKVKVSDCLFSWGGAVIGLNCLLFAVAGLTWKM